MVSDSAPPPSVTRESIIDVEGVVVRSPQPIESCTQQHVELHCAQLWVVSASEPQLPLQIEDACRPDTEVPAGAAREGPRTEQCHWVPMTRYWYIRQSAKVARS